jgi:hypothetical protein
MDLVEEDPKFVDEPERPFLVSFLHIITVNVIKNRQDKRSSRFKPKI